ncbi:hypothetical protein PIB30_021917 [Stylosanthes scabra]|uniref:Uncharacterized protein n=1 Tax=Stylosanthes scabra TaxID=79078 RepID=A0ABU6TAN9_9FABA|nr:hypothetical protein [Stylosanthes scabra]
MGRNKVKSFAAFCTPLPTRVRTLRHRLNLVRKRKSVFPGDSRIHLSSYNLKCCLQTPPMLAPLFIQPKIGSDHRDAQYFNPWENDPNLVLGILNLETFFLNGDRAMEKASNDEPHPELRQNRTEPWFGSLLNRLNLPIRSGS